MEAEPAGRLSLEFTVGSVVGLMRRAPHKDGLNGLQCQNCLDGLESRVGARVCLPSGPGPNQSKRCMYVPGWGGMFSSTSLVSGWMNVTSHRQLKITPNELQGQMRIAWYIPAALIIRTAEQERCPCIL